MILTGRVLEPAVFCFKIGYMSSSSIKIREPDRFPPYVPGAPKESSKFCVFSRFVFTRE